MSLPTIVPVTNTIVPDSRHVDSSRVRRAWRGVLRTSVLLAVLGADAASAGVLPGLEGWYPGQSYDQLFSADHVTRATGRVLSVDRIVPREGMAEGVRLAVAAGAESLDVHLGPALFVDAQKLRLSAGDEIAVTGVSATLEGRPIVLAIKVERAGQTLRLREQDGTPAWLGFKPRGDH